MIESGGRPLLPNVVMQAAINDPRLAQAIEAMMKKAGQGPQGPLALPGAAERDVFIAVFARKQSLKAAEGKGATDPLPSVSPLDPDVPLEGSQTVLDASDVRPTVLPAEGNESRVSVHGEEAAVVAVEPLEAGARGEGAASTAVVANVESAGDHLEEVGCLARIVGMFPSSPLGVLAPSTFHLRGVERIRRTRTVGADPLTVEFRVEPDEPHDADSQEIRAATVELANSLGKLTREEDSVHHRHFVFQRIQGADVTKPGALAYLASWLCLHGGSDRSVQAVLEQRAVLPRVRSALELIEREVRVMELQQDLRKQLEEKIGRDQQRYMLMEKLKLLKKQLGMEKDERAALSDKFREKLEELRPRAAPEVVKAIEEELDRLQVLEPASSEFSVSRNYLEWLTCLPWGVHSPDKYDLSAARTVLDSEHYGLKDVKERILEFIAVSKLRGSAQGKILCLVGPPGVGKTSIAKSVAKALGREYYRVAVGGLSDVAEIKGHRRTYIGAMPGRLAQCLKAVKVANPLILIDEIDKLGSGGYRGDPSSALLEVLDPSQNATFSDHYLDVPMDLSKVLFMCTANVLDTIPGPLLDRMEVIRLSGYTAEEKTEIARVYLEPSVRAETGVGAQASLTVPAIRRLIEDYAREAGVRNLRAQLEKIYRKVAFKLVELEQHATTPPVAPPAVPLVVSSDASSAGQVPEGAAGPSHAPPGTEIRPVPPKEEGLPVTVDSGDLESYLGPPVFQSDRIYPQTPVGVVTGLAWTAMGGSTLYIEAVVVERAKDKGSLRTTGQLGDVMKESTSIAHTYARTFLQELDPTNPFFSEAAIHVHVPAGAVPKDGPSAGVTLVCALMSLALNRPLVADVSMTGELTITGKVLPIGGVREKCISAKRSGVCTVILPEGNRRDWDEIPSEVRDGIQVRERDSLHKNVCMYLLVTFNDVQL